MLITLRNPMKIDEFGEFSDKLTSALPTYTISSSEEFASIKGTVILKSYLITIL